MRSVAVVLKRPPYGQIEAAEAVRHALGAAAGGALAVRMVLVDGGVLLARCGQEAADGGLMNLGEALQDALHMGVAVYAAEASLRESGLAPEHVAAGVQIASESSVAELIGSADAALIF